MTKQEIIGKSVIGTVEIYDEDKKLKEIIELVGQVMSIDDEKGIIICNHDTNKAIALPVVLNAFRPAQKGYYTLQSGAKIKNPDLICDMSVYQND